jgi:hypothetical protein
MERATFGAERTRAACQLFGNLALDLERVPAAMATAGNGHHDAPLNFEVSDSHGSRSGNARATVRDWCRNHPAVRLVPRCSQNRTRWNIRTG